MTKVVFEPKDTVSPELRKRLMRSFKPEVIRFGKLVGQDVSARWGYDSI
jgi:hypothetical protein